MSEEPFNLVLEHLRVLRSDIGAMRETQLEHGIKLNRLEESLAGVRRDIALHDEQLAQRRLELSEA